MAKNLRLRRERRLEAARGYLMLDMPDHALRELNGIEDPERATFAIQQLRGEALRQKEDYEAAIDAYQRARDENAGDLTVLMGLAWCYKRRDRLDRAIELMREAYEVAPEEAVVLYNLACYFSLSGDKEQALSWLGRALRMDSSLRKLIPEETDFDPLRDDPDFQFIAHPPHLSDSE